MSKTIILTKAELSELLVWADNMFTNSLMSTFGGDLSDRLWKLYNEKSEAQKLIDEIGDDGV